MSAVTIPYAYALVENMEELQVKHRQEQRDLQSRITQKKKSATKKTRKGVNDECAGLERDLLQKQAAEVAQLTQQENPTNGTEDTITEDQHESAPADGNSEVSENLQPRSVTEIQNAESRKKPNRQKARLARRAAEQEAEVEAAAKEAENLPDLRQQEREKMQEAARARDLQEHDTRPDGHCLYASIADQLRTHGIDWKSSSYASAVPDVAATPPPEYRAIRFVAASYMAAHSDEFSPFLEQPLEQHLHDVKDTGEWGGHTELLAIAKAFSLNIKILHADGRISEIEGRADGRHDQASSLWLAYYQHSFGLGEHYNSLRSKNG